MYVLFLFKYFGFKNDYLTFLLQFCFKITYLFYLSRLNKKIHKYLKSGTNDFSSIIFQQNE